MKILITGSFGFVGSNVVNKLGSLYDVQLHARYRKAYPEFNHLKVFEFIIDSKSDWSEALNGVSTVIHLANIAHNKSLDRDLITEVNLLGTENLAKAAINSGVSRFIFLSTANLNYYRNVNNSQNKISDFCNHIKLLTELRLKKISKESGMDLVIIRAPLVYGDGVKANFASLINLVKNNFPLPFGAINNNRRSLVSVYNLADLMEKCIYHPNAANQTFLVSDDHDVSTSEIVKLLAVFKGVKPWLIPVPVWMLKSIGKIAGKYDKILNLTDSFQLDITHTKETLGWSPPYSIEEGFEMCIHKTIDNVDNIEE